MKLFTKFLKDYVVKGLGDRQEDVDSPERKFVEATNIVMICARRGADGSYLQQSDDKNYPWMQYVHLVPDGCASKPARQRMQTFVMNKINKLAAKTTWPATYDKGKDLTDSNELGVDNSKLLDEDTAELILSMYEINNSKVLHDFYESEQMTDFFANLSRGKTALAHVWEKGQD